MNILIWILIWYAAFAGYYLFFKKRNILYKNRPKLIIGWYALISLIGIFVFHTQLKLAVVNSTISSEVLGLLIVATSLVVWYKALIGRGYVEREVSRNIFLSKTSEIIFQQVFVWALFGILQGVLLIINPVVLFTLVFFIIHIPLLLVIPWKKAMFFVAASLVGGVVFAICLLYVPSGYLLALAIHTGFYAAVASKKRIWGIDTFYVM
jgi:hypothetical protein